MIISDVEKTIDKIQHHFHDKGTGETRDMMDTFQNNRGCDGLNKNGLHNLIYLNALSPGLFEKDQKGSKVWPCWKDSVNRSGLC